MTTEPVRVELSPLVDAVPGRGDVGAARLLQLVEVDGGVEPVQRRLCLEPVARLLHRPHRSLPHRATPATLYDTMPKVVPDEVTEHETHDRTAN